MAPNLNDPLRPLLKDAERELQLRVEEVCDKPRVSQESTGELIRLEETLSLAAEAAKKTVSLRRRLRQGERRPDDDMRASDREASP